MHAESERRRHPRVQLDGRMTGRATILADFRIVALSETGAALEMDLPLVLGSSCDLTLNLAHVSVDLRGRVVHVAPPAEPGAPYQVGVDFLGVDDLDRALLESFLERERSRAL
jgi:hypothetical protein